MSSLFVSKYIDYHQSQTELGDLYAGLCVAERIPPQQWREVILLVPGLGRWSGGGGGTSVASLNEGGGRGG